MFHLEQFKDVLKGGVLQMGSFFIKESDVLKPSVLDTTKEDKE